MPSSEEDLYFREKLKIARRRAKSKNIEFDLNMKWIRSERKTYCPILGTKLHYVKNNGGFPPENIPSIDRIDNSLGYTQDNCRIISYRANTLLSNSNLWEMNRLFLSVLQDCNNPSTIVKNSQLCRKHPSYDSKFSRLDNEKHL